MAYIGNARSLIIIGSNTRDDLVSTVPGQVTFELSQEVPGGYESNITVLRQKYIKDQLVSNTTTVTIGEVDQSRRTTPSTERLLTCNNVSVAAALSVVKPGDVLIVSIPSDPLNSLNDTTGFSVNEVNYSGSTIQIYLSTTVSGEVNTTQNNTQVSLTIGYEDNWNILDPEKDYTISSANGKTNRYITLKDAPQLNDKVYVLHKGEATYNFVPSAKSVGPNQLSENLRTFKCDRYVANGGTTFAITGTEDPEFTVVDAKSLLVTVGGEVADSDYKETDGTPVQGEWQLDSARDSQNRQTITFHVAPQSGKLIRILNLGFSTVSRRALFSTGQASTPGSGSVGEGELKNECVSEAKLKNNAVSTNKIQNNAVNGQKILLNNNESLRSKTNTALTVTPEFELLKLGSDNITHILGNSEVSVNISGSKKVSVNATEIYPETTNDISLGTITNKFKDLSLSGTASIQGNIVLGGTVDGVDVSALKVLVDNIKDYINSGALSPIGSIMIWTSTTVPTGWIRCTGAALNTYTHRELHAIISNTYGGTPYQNGITNVPTATTTFNLPDLVTRFPVGANQNATNIGIVENPNVPQENRTLLHTHTGAAHTHDLNNHTHSVPGHYHAVDTTSATTTPVALNIATSGSHTTRIDHTHKNAQTTYDSTKVRTNQTAGQVYDTLSSATELPNLDKMDWSSTQGRGTHPHSSFYTEYSGSLDHTHRSWTTNGLWYAYIGTVDYLVSSSVSLSHTHKMTAKGTNDSGGESTVSVSKSLLGLGTGSINLVTNTDPHNHDINDDGSGSRSVATGPDGGSESGALTRWTKGPWTTEASDLSHYHTIGAWTTAGSSYDLNHRHTASVPDGSGGHDHAGGLTMEYKNVDAHPNINSSNASDLRGTHIHGAASFSGAIGLRSGNNGNGNFSTQGPSNNNTGVANYGTNVSGPGVSPHLVVNFIIKAFNPTVS